MRTRRGTRRAALLACAVVVPLTGLLAGVLDGTAQADTASATVPDVAEAWYAAAPIDVCTTPLGCPPDQMPTSPYPAGSLHVGVAAGQETARAYLQPDLSQLGAATLLRGAMTIHVDTSDTDGSLAPESAKLLACLVTAPVTDGTAGATTPPPAVDCTTSTHPSYNATTGVLTVDLEPFLKAWNGGAQQLGIALVPNQTQLSQTDAWHVTIEGRKQAGAKPPTSTIDFQPHPLDAVIPGVVLPPPTAPANPSNASADVPLPPATSSGAVSAPAPVVAPASPTSPTSPATAAQRPVAFAGPITKPAAFLAPLALLAGVVFFARLFTRDATPKKMWA